MKILNMNVAPANLIRFFVLVILYVLLGNIPQIQQNPVISDATLAVNMIVIVIAGILYGRNIGLTVGLFGTFFNALSPAGNAFEFAAIVPHAIMGWASGLLKENTNSFWASLAIVLGHLLNIIIFLFAGLVTLSGIDNSFWYGLAFEAILGVISINLIVFIYRLICGKKN
ncbi:hypothetical protein GF386_02330 [Candidatus Pacearchaeota archaeon]|nr:hypothetical protein [Candidatus Pacearchaeota archaeon]MBD3282995.1 hypothetical protein [Candidatus Pacearchaeota archaeon]